MFLSRDLNFTKTAERCYVSQSVLSRHIRALEQETNSKLLVRDKRGVHLTPAGDAFAMTCKRMLEIYDESLERINAMCDGFDDILRISYMLTPANNLLDRAYERQLSRWPRVKVELLSSWERRVFTLLSQNKVDLGIALVFEEPDPKKYQSLCLEEGSFDVFVPADHPLAARSAITAFDLAGETVLIPSELDHPVQHRQITDVLSAVPRIVLRDSVGNMLDAVALVNSGRGVALVRHGMLDGEYQGAGVVVPLDEPRLAYGVYALWRQDNSADYLGAFAEILRELVEEDARESAGRS